MIIHLVRHGLPQTDSDGLYVPNAGLNEIGRQQAIRAANRVATFRPEATYSSNLPRAIETAEHFTAISNHELRQIPELAELNTGDIWNAPSSIKKRITGGDYHVDYKSLGGESLTEFNARVIKGFSHLLQAASSDGLARIAAFLHEGVIGTIIDHLEGRSAFDSQRRATMPYGSLITVDTESPAPHYPGHWDADHLQ